jgi:hypothetical protein
MNESSISIKSLKVEYMDKNIVAQKIQKNKIFYLKFCMVCSHPFVTRHRTVITDLPQCHRVLKLNLLAGVPPPVDPVLRKKEFTADVIERLGFGGESNNKINKHAKK